MGICTKVCPRAYTSELVIAAGSCVATKVQKQLATTAVNHKVDWCSRFR